MKQPERLYNLRFTDACIIENNMWLMNMNFSGLFKVDLSSYDIEFESCIYDNEQIKSSYFARNIIYKYNKLWLLPYVGSSIVEYDIESNHMQFYINNLLKDTDCDNKVNHWTILYKEQAWIFPQILINTELPLYVFDLNKREYSEHISWNKALMEHGICGENHSITSILHKDEWVWIVVSGINELISYNLENGEMQLYSIGENIVLQSVSHDEYSFWLLAKNESSLLQWDQDQGIINKYEFNSDNHNLEGYSNIAIVQDKIIVLPRKGEKIVILEKKTETLKTLDSFPKGFRRIEGMETSSLIYGWKIFNNKLLLLPWSGNMLLELNLQTYELRGHSVELSDRMLRKAYRLPKMGIFSEKGIFPRQGFGGVRESEHFNLEDYFYVINKERDLKRAQIKKDEPGSGKRIYEYIKEELY